MWEINAADQMLTVLFSFLTGIAFSLIYDVFKAMRLSFKKGTLAVFFEDILFCAVCTLITFCLLMLRTKGQLRLFVFSAEGAGFLSARWVLSPYTVAVLRLVLRFLSFAYGWVCGVLSGVGRKCRIFFEKIFKFILSLL